MSQVFVVVQNGKSIDFFFLVLVLILFVNSLSWFIFENLLHKIFAYIQIENNKCDMC